MSKSNYLTSMLVLTLMLFNVSISFADSDVYKEMLTLNLEDVTFDEDVSAIENQSEYVFLIRKYLITV